MIKIFLIVILCLFAFYIIVGRKLAKNIKASSERKYKQEQQRAAWREGYQAEKIKIAIEQGRAAARAEELQPTLDLRKIDSPQKKPKGYLEKEVPDIGSPIKTEKKPICIEHNFEGKNWLDYARHIRKYHKIKK